MRPRMSKKTKHHVHGKSKTDTRLKKLERLERELEHVSDEIREEIGEVEKLEEVETRKKEFAWIRGGVSYLILQDFVGAAFGAMFFAVTQEVWDLAARMNALQTTVVVFLSFFMGYALVYFSRRRKSVSRRAYHTVFLRGFEMYVTSFLVSVLFVVMLATASMELVPVVKQAALISMPATLSAATADLLFY